MVKSSMQEDLKAARENLPGAAPVPVRTAPEEDPIQDEYAGNSSYEQLRRSAAETAVPQAPAAPSEVREILADLDRVDRQQEAQEEWEEEKMRQDAAGARREILTRVGKKRILLLGVGMMLLFFATMYVLKERSQQAAAPQGKAGTFLSDTSKVGNANDATRIKSLDAIAQAAALYHIEERADLPVSPSYIRLDEANEVSDFFKRALSAYGKPENLLLDPRAPGYYYTYRSLDGMSLELGAHIEDSSSIDCTNQDPCLYRKVLLEEDISKVRQDLDTYKQSF